MSGQEVNYREAVEGFRTWREENARLKEELRVSHADARELRVRQLIVLGDIYSSILGAT